jgi:type VI secretion system secreted protein Hcp
MKLKHLLAATLGAAATVAVTATLGGAAGNDSIAARTSAAESYQVTAGYATVEGAVQGAFAATPGNPAGFDKHVRVYGFESLLTVPVDAGTGQVSGQRKHAPFTLAIPLGAASVQAFKAATTAENLKTVELSLLDSAGAVYYKLKLTNARIVSVRQYHTGTARTHELAELQLVFQKIELEDVASRTKAIDSWSGGPA